MIDVTLEQTQTLHINPSLIPIHIITYFDATPITSVCCESKHVAVASETCVVVAREMHRQVRCPLN